MSKIERNELDEAVRELALRHAPQQLVKVGDVVTSKGCDWKLPHQVRITIVAVEIVEMNMSFKRMAEMGVTGYLAVRYRYAGKRLTKRGAAVVANDLFLDEFTTDDGIHYEALRSLYSYSHLCWVDIEREAAGGGE